MAVTRGEGMVLAAAAMLAIGMPALLLRPAARVTPAASAPSLGTLAPPAVPPSATLSRRSLFATDASPVAEAPLPADAPQLVGIVGRIGRDAVAMVRGAGGINRTLAVGESVDGWRLESLAIDAGFFTRGNERLRVPLPAGEGQ